MIHHVCELCGYEYDPTEGDEENGIEPGTEFEDLRNKRGLRRGIDRRG